MRQHTNKRGAAGVNPPGQVNPGSFTGCVQHSSCSCWHSQLPCYVDYTTCLPHLQSSFNRHQLLSRPISYFIFGYPFHERTKTSRGFVLCGKRNLTNKNHRCLIFIQRKCGCVVVSKNTQCLLVEIYSKIIAARISENEFMKENMISNCVFESFASVCILLHITHGEAKSPQPKLNNVRTRQDSKCWFAFVNAVLVHSNFHEVLQLNHSLCEVWKKLKDFSARRYIVHKTLYIRDKTLQQSLHKNKGTNTHWQFPLSMLKVLVLKRIANLDKHKYYNQIHTLIFTIHNSLQLETTFTKMIIYSKLLTRCFPGVTIISKSPKWTRGLDFCGVRNNFKVYLCYHTIFFKIIFSNTVEFHLQTLFNLRTAGLISTDTAHTDVVKKDPLLLVFTLVISVVQQVENNYHVATNASHVISVHLSNGVTGGVYHCYDGPTSQERKVTITQLPAELQSTTFQILIHAIGDIKILFLLVAIRRYVSLNINHPSTVKGVQGSTLRENIAFVSHQNLNNSLNVSVKHYSFTGHETPSCQFGGLWLFETESQDMYSGTFHPTQIFSLCTPVMHQKLFIQNMYSSKTTILFLAYTFAHQSSLEIVLQISHTSCNPVVFDVCDYQLMKTNIVQMNLMQSKGFSLFGRQATEININAETSTCSVVQLVSNNMFSASKRIKGLCTAVVLFHENSKRRQGKYHVKGFFSTRYMHSPVLAKDFLCPVHAINQYFIVGGDNFVSEKTKISVREAGSQRYLNSRNDTCLFDTKRRSIVRSGFYQLTGLHSHFYINPTNRQSILLDMTFFASMPTGDLGLTFMYQPLSVKSWIEIMFSSSDENVLTMPLDRVYITEVKQSPKLLFRKMVMEMSIIGDGNHIEDQGVDVDLHIHMRVSVC